MKLKNLLLAFALLPLLTLRTFAATETVDGIEWTYTIVNGKASVGGGSLSSPAVSTSTKGDLTIPSVLGGRPVTSIGDWAFYYCSGLTSVTIPSSVTSIGSWAFEDCSGLTTIAVDEANSAYCSEDGMLFDKAKTTLIACPGGKRGAVTIPSSVTSIGDYAFYHCSGLTSVTIPSSVTSIGSSAFYGCSGLTSLTIPSSVTSIGYEAFGGCSGLTSIAVNEANLVYSSEDGMLFDKAKTMIIACPSGKRGTVTIPPSVTSIGNYAFFGCSGLTSVTIPSSVTSIGDWAFRYCSGLESVTIPSSVTSIGDGAFRYCYGLASVTIPSSVTSIGTGAFGSTPFYENMPDGMVVLGGGVLYGYKGDCPSSVTIPSSVTSIRSSAFRGCSGLESVTIPSSVTSIGEGAFLGCSGLTEVTIPSSVTSIGNSAFYGCDSLRLVHVCPGDTERVKGLIRDSRSSGIAVDALVFIEDVVEPIVQVVTITNVIDKIVERTNIVNRVVEQTNVINRVVEQTNVVEKVVEVPLIAAGGVFVSEATAGYEPSAGFDGSAKRFANGLVCDGAGAVVGIAQVSTAKESKKGVKVSGFVILGDGKKQALKAVTVPPREGLVAFETKVGKIGTLTATIGADGFRGTLGAYTVVSADMGDAGILSGSLTLSCLDPVKGKLLKKKLTVGGIAAEGAAAGTVKAKGESERRFVAEME